MSIINGKALVKDGNAVDKVFSNGRQVYGRNLLTNSRLQSGNITPFAPVNNAVLTINSNVKGLNVYCSGGAISYIQGATVRTMPVSAGNQYTISVKVINSGIVTIDRFALQFQFYYSSGASNFQLKNFSIPADEKVYSFSFTYTAPTNAVSVKCYFLDIATSVNISHTFTIYDMKFELGSTATPHTPAPEDYI